MYRFSWELHGSFWLSNCICTFSIRSLQLNLHWYWTGEKNSTKKSVQSGRPALLQVPYELVSNTKWQAYGTTNRKGTVIQKLQVMLGTLHCSVKQNNLTSSLHRFMPTADGMDAVCAHVCLRSIFWCHTNKVDVAAARGKKIIHGHIDTWIHVYSTASTLFSKTAEEFSLWGKHLARPIQHNMSHNVYPERRDGRCHDVLTF